MHFQILDVTVNTSSGQLCDPRSTAALNMALGLTQRSLDCPCRSPMTLSISYFRVTGSLHPSSPPLMIHQITSIIFIWQHHVSNFFSIEKTVTTIIHSAQKHAQVPPYIPKGKSILILGFENPPDNTPSKKKREIIAVKGILNTVMQMICTEFCFPLSDPLTLLKSASLTQRGKNYQIIAKGPGREQRLSLQRRTGNPTDKRR